MPADGAPRPVAFEPGGSALRLLTCRTSERPDHPFLWVEERGPWTLGGLTAAAASERLAAKLVPSSGICATPAISAGGATPTISSSVGAKSQACAN